MSNFISWNAKKQTEFIIKKLGFETSQGRERTFNLYDKLDDIHANGLHDYLKYLKFGYGRCTDDVATEIRHGRITRNAGIELVKKYDHVKPSDMKIFLRESKMTEKQFLKSIDKFRDPSIWEKKNNKWITKDSVANHKTVNEKKVSRNSRQKLFLKTKEKKSLHSQPNNNQTKYVIL